MLMAIPDFAAGKKVHFGDYENRKSFVFVKCVKRTNAPSVGAND